MFLSTTAQAAALSALLVGGRASPIKRQNIAPALEVDFPDPSVFQAPDGYWYAYATSGNGVAIQVAKSIGGLDWELQSGVDALGGNSISWSEPNHGIWAPDVTLGADGSYWMYFAASAKAAGGKYCIGFATATDPLGPFTPIGDEPWVCDTDTGDIDPDQFLDADGKRYVTWKVDGNSAGHDSTPIMIQEVDSNDGVTKIGDAVQILDRDSNDGPLVEAPSLIVNEGIYYLTFSSNMYDTDLYDTSFATASSVKGPYTKATDPDAPILKTGMSGLIGPGGADMLNYPGPIVWHGWNSSDTEHRARYMYAASWLASDGTIDIFL